MSELSIIHLSTESGSWHYDASEKNDPYFGEYLSSLAEVGPLPSTIVFREGVAEILEEEWDTVMLLVSYISQSNIWDWLIFSPIFSQLVPLTDAWHEVDDSVYVPLGITLGDVARISRIITLPSQWRLYVEIGENVSEREKIDHLISVANTLRDIYTLEPTEGWSRIHSVVWQVNECVKAAKDEEKNTIAGILWAALRDGALSVLVNDVNRRDLIPSDMKWDVVIASLERLGWTETLAYNTALTFEGRGVADNRTAPMMFDIDPDGDIILSEAFLGHLYRVYHSVLDSVPSKTSVLLPLFNGGPLPREPNTIDSVDNDIMRVVPWVHSIIAFALNYNFDDEVEPVDDQLAYIYLLDRFIVGRRGLMKIASASGSVALRDEILRYTSDVDEPEVVMRFPLPIEVLRARKYTKRMKK